MKKRRAVLLLSKKSDQTEALRVAQAMGIKFLLTHDFSEAKTILESCGEKHLSGFIGNFHTTDSNLQVQNEAIDLCRLAGKFFLPTIAYFNPNNKDLRNELLSMKKNDNISEFFKLQVHDAKEIDWRQLILEFNFLLHN